MKRTEYIKTVERYSNNLYKIALSYCKNKYDAEDILQNVFIKLLQSEEEFQSDEHLKRWLMRVTVNCCKDYCSSFWKRRMTGLDEARREYVQEFSTLEQSELYEQVLKLPETIVPLCVIAIGHPAEQPTPKNKWKPENVSYNEFGGKAE